jgi:tyrosinase
MASTYAIKGIPLPKHPDPHHPIPVRQEITSWYSNPDNAIQVSLYIQALSRFQQLPIDKKVSYFQVAGLGYLPFYRMRSKTYQEFMACQP